MSSSPGAAVKCTRFIRWAMKCSSLRLAVLFSDTLSWPKHVNILANTSMPLVKLVHPAGASICACAELIWTRYRLSVLYSISRNVPKVRTRTNSGHRYSWPTIKAVFMPTQPVVNANSTWPVVTKRYCCALRSPRPSLRISVCRINTTCARIDCYRTTGNGSRARLNYSQPN